MEVRLRHEDALMLVHWLLPKIVYGLIELNSSTVRIQR